MGIITEDIVIHDGHSIISLIIDEASITKNTIINCFSGIYKIAHKLKEDVHIIH